MENTLAIDLLITRPELDAVPGPPGSSDCGKGNDTLAIDLLITRPELDAVPGPPGSSDCGKGNDTLAIDLLITRPEYQVLLDLVIVEKVMTLLLLTY